MQFKVKYYDQNKDANDVQEVQANTPDQASNIVRKNLGGKVAIITCSPVKSQPQPVLD